MIPKNRWIGKKEQILTQSPLYRFSQTDIADGGALVIALEDIPYDKYAPYNFLQVTNKTDQDLLIQTNVSTIKISHGVILSFDEETLPAFRSVVIKNSSGSTATGDVEVLVQKVASYRMAIKGAL